MKNTHSIIRTSAVSLAVFLTTAGAGYGISSSLLHAIDHDGVMMNAMIMRARSSSSTSSVSSRKKVKKSVIRGVKRTSIVRPSTRRSTGAVLREAAPSSSPRVPVKASCGDKLLITDLGEECDDGNILNGDGCTAACKIEAGFFCAGNPSICVSRCGDGIITPLEKCDDGNRDGGDGCSGSCKKEIGYVCSGSPSVCELIPYCGDGIKASSEQCDDGNTIDIDSCSNVCTLR